MNVWNEAFKLMANLFLCTATCDLTIRSQLINKIFSQLILVYITPHAFLKQGKSEVLNFICFKMLQQARAREKFITKNSRRTTCVINLFLMRLTFRHVTEINAGILSHL